jgi:hypothetical protein
MAIRPTRARPNSRPAQLPPSSPPRGCVTGPSCWTLERMRSGDTQHDREALQQVLERSSVRRSGEAQFGSPVWRAEAMSNPGDLIGSFVAALMYHISAGIREGSEACQTTIVRGRRRGSKHPGSRTVPAFASCLTEVLRHSSARGSTQLFGVREPARPDRPHVRLRRWRK